MRSVIAYQSAVIRRRHSVKSQVRRSWWGPIVAALLLSLLSLICMTGCGSATEPEISQTPTGAGPSSPGFLIVSQNGGLTRLNHNGQNPVPLTSGFRDQHPSFSPDGSQVIFSRSTSHGSGAADIYRMRLDSSDLTNLTAGFPLPALDPEYSFDGQKIAFSARVSGTEQNIYVMNADGTNPQQVTSGPDIDQTPAFSPDGQTLVFQRGNHISTVAVTGGLVSNLTDGLQVDTFPSYCPPGDPYIVIFTRGGELWALQGETLFQVTHTSAESEFLARHSREHDTLYALASSAPTSGIRGIRSQSQGPSGNLYSLRPDGSGRKQLTNNLQANGLTVGPRLQQAPSSTFTMNMVNNSTDTLYVYVFGYDPTNSGTPSYLDTDGTVKAYSAGTGIPPVVATVAGNGGAPASPLTLPLLNKARIYFSNNPNLTFTAFEESPSLTDGSELFDFVEYDYSTPGGVFTADTSCVEAFALPFKIESVPAGSVNGVATPVGMDAAGRSNVFASITALGDPWTRLIVTNPTTQAPTRLLAPWHGDMASPPFPADYLAPSIALQWGQTIKLNTYLQNPAQYYQASQSSGAWVFKPASGSGASVTYPNPPDSKTAFSCDIPFQSTDQQIGSRLTAMLAAGLNRGTLLYPNLNPAPIPFVPVTSGQPDFSPVDFYKPGSPAPQVPQVNEYANILHQNSIKGYQYGFASDDQGSQSSTLTVPSGIQSITVTVSSF